MTGVYIRKEINKTCLRCNSIFITKSHSSKYCKKCRYLSSNNYCLDCKKLISQRAMRCSKCSNSKQHNPSYKNGLHIKGKKCLKCNSSISTGGSNFCLKCCDHKGRFKKNTAVGISSRFKNNIAHPNWKGGISFEPYPLGWTDIYKEQIRFRDDYKCKLCGCSEVKNKRKLSVHHIDYNKSNLDINNLISLCTCCHAKTGEKREEWRERLVKLL